MMESPTPAEQTGARSNHFLSDRAAGVLLGQASGDALGVPYEFGPALPDDLQPRMLGGGLGPYQPAEWSDDTQMALCIARVAARGVDLAGTEALDAVAEAYLGWAAGGATDIGAQTKSVLHQADQTSGPAGQRLNAAARRYTETHPHSAGNGALMRTAIIGISSIDDRDHTARSARAQAGLTHADPLAAESCVLWSEAVRIAVTQGRLDLISGLDLVPVQRRDQWATWIAEATATDPKSFPRNGFTVTALQAAWAAISSTPIPADDPDHGSFACLHLQHALARAVRIGQDTDTVAAIAGGLLGAYWGASAIPAEWWRRLHGWPGCTALDVIDLALRTATKQTTSETRLLPEDLSQVDFVLADAARTLEELQVKGAPLDLASVPAAPPAERARVLIATLRAQPLEPWSTHLTSKPCY